jgi:hypothetical protein
LLSTVWKRGRAPLRQHIPMLVQLFSRHDSECCDQRPTTGNFIRMGSTATRKFPGQ